MSLDCHSGFGNKEPTRLNKGTATAHLRWKNAPCCFGRIWDYNHMWSMIHERCWYIYGCLLETFSFQQQQQQQQQMCIIWSIRPWRLLSSWIHSTPSPVWLLWTDCHCAQHHSAQQSPVMKSCRFSKKTLAFRSMATSQAIATASPNIKGTIGKWWEEEQLVLWWHTSMSIMCISQLLIPPAQKKQERYSHCSPAFSFHLVFEPQILFSFSN